MSAVHGPPAAIFTFIKKRYQMNLTISHYFFDWGDTLMVDFPEGQGPMYRWPQVAAVAGARKTLAVLHREAGCYLATNARDSKEREIVKALERVGLAIHIDKVFCFQNVRYLKPSPEFFNTILERTGAAPSQAVMVGDSLETDVAGAMEVGMHGIWYNPAGRQGRPAGAGVIRSLTELI